MNELKILAFMQNMWVKDPAKVQKSLDRWKDKPEFWNNMVKTLLFAGCLTGRNIKKAFGQDLALSIIWDETTKEIADNPKYVPKADLEHMRNTILRVRPDVIITFGKNAESALEKIILNKNVFYHIRIPKHIFHAPHPAYVTRNPKAMDTINWVADRIKELVK